MATLRVEIEEFELMVGERAEAISIGAAVRYPTPGDYSISTPLDRETAFERPELDAEYDAAMGSTSPPNAIYAWTENWVMFLSGDDGGSGPTWVPRHPVPSIVITGGIAPWTRGASTPPDPAPAAPPVDQS